MTQRQGPRGKTGLIVLLPLLALVIAGVDQVTKYLAEARLTPGVVTPLIGDYLGLQLIYNPGAAFSLATGMTWVLTAITIVVIVVILRVSRRLRSTGWAFALGLLLGGAVGNLYDRLVRDPGFGRGHVVDFINYNGWFVGNVADIAIVLAAVLIALLALRGVEIDGSRVSADDEDEPVAASPEEYLDEEPVEDEGFSPQVPQATGEAVDVASWAAGAPSASAAGAGPLDVVAAQSPTDAHSVTTTEAGDPAEPAVAEDSVTTPESVGPTPATEPMPAVEQTPAIEPEPAAGPDPAAEPREPAPAAPATPTSSWAERFRPTPRRRPTRREIRLEQSKDDG